MNRVHDNQGTTETGSSSEESRVHNVGRHSIDPVYIKTLINGKRLSMEFGTGAEVSIISEKTREEIPRREVTTLGSKTKDLYQ